MPEAQQPEAAKIRFPGSEVHFVAGHDPRRVPGDRQFDQVFIRIVSEVQAPGKGDTDPKAITKTASRSTARSSGLVGAAANNSYLARTS